MLNNRWYQKHVKKSILKYKIKKQKFVDGQHKMIGVNLRRYIHPFLRKILHIRNKLYGITYEIYGCKLPLDKKESIIYALTHIGKFDFEVFMDACNVFCYPVAGDWELMYGEIDDYFLRLNGVLYVDTDDKVDRKYTNYAMNKMLLQGISILIYPEGVWNLTECLPMMKIFPGTVRTAQETKVPIIPVAIEQEGKHFCVNIGERFYVNGDIKSENERLRDTMATLQWNNWEHLSKLQREEISDNYYENFVQSKLAEWPKYNMEIIKKRIYKDRT